MAFYESAVRPLLFSLSPDRTHSLAHSALQFSPAWAAIAELSALAVDDARLRTRFAGIDLPNPIGLAAGFDKNCTLMPSLCRLGFGFVTVGSIMPQPRRGNPFPRLVRYPKTFSMADAMGMPSDGRERCAERLRRFKPSETPLFVNVAGFSPEDIVASVLAIAPHADAVEITIMCPNLKASNHAEEMEILSGVLDRLEGCARPIVIRIPNEAARSEDRLAEMIERCVAGGVAGLKIGNGRQVAAPQLGVGQGTLHGRDIFEGAVANVARAVRLSRGRLSIKANGGISSGGDVVTMLRAGAACVDIYSAFIYRGWSVARAINRELLAELKLLGRDASHVGQAVV